MSCPTYKLDDVFFLSHILNLDMFMLIVELISKILFHLFMARVISLLCFVVFGGKCLGMGRFEEVELRVCMRVLAALVVRGFGIILGRSREVKMAKYHALFTLSKICLIWARPKFVNFVMVFCFYYALALFTDILN